MYRKIIILALILAIAGCRPYAHSCTEGIGFHDNQGDNIDEALDNIEKEDGRHKLTLWPESSVEEVLDKDYNKITKELFMVVYHVELENGSLSEGSYGHEFLDKEGNRYVRWTCK